MLLNFTVVLALLAVSAQAQEATKVFRDPTASLITQAVDNSLRVVLQGNTHPLALPEFDRGAVAADLPENNVILLLKRSPAQRQALERLLARQQDPNDPLYHKWLQPEEFGAQFGVSQKDIDTIADWLKSFGLLIEDIPAAHSSIQFSGTAGQIERAFRTSIHKYQIDGRSHFANSESPQIPEALAPAVSSILSLHDFHSRTNAHIVGRVPIDSGSGAIRPLYTASPGSSYYLVPFDFFAIYNELPLFSASTPIDGTGQSIAIVARSSIKQSDVNTFRSLFLPGYSQNLLNTIVAGSQNPGDVPGDDTEAALDVEWAGSTAPKATIDLVLGASTNSTDGAALSASYIVNHNVAPVLSMSFGLCEADLGTGGNSYYSSLWQQAAAEGITVLVSSGDSGSAGCESADYSGRPNSPTLARSGLNVNGLSSTPFNLSVGGTQFTDSSNYSAYWNTGNGNKFQSAKGYIPASAWNESCSPAQCGAAYATLWSGGGGSSGIYLKPGWQSGVPGIPNDNARDVPDISLNAAGHDGYYVYMGGYLLAVSGTSASSPSFAGVMALINQKTGTRQGLANPALYSLASANAGSLAQCNGSTASAPAGTCIFYDITAGSNAVPCAGASPSCSSKIQNANGSLTGFSAGFGYDLATGLGAVNIANLVNNWTVPTLAPPAVLGSNPPSGSGVAQAFSFTFSDARGWQDLGVLNVLINSSLDGRQACYLAYNSPNQTLYLVADDGSGISAGLALGSSGTLSNGQCTVLSSGSSAVGNGNSITLTVNLSFASTFSGNKILFAAARDTTQRTSGWQTTGVWQVPTNSPPTTTVVATGMSPNSGSGQNQTFAFTFSDSKGSTDIGVVDVLFNTSLDGRNACYLAYSQPAKTLYLVGNDGSTLSAGLALNGAGTVSNGQCTVSSQGSSASGAGKVLTLNMNITFSSSFAGNRIAYVAGRDISQANNTGWQALGSWSVQ